MTVEQRRQELVELGMELFSAQPYDDVWVEDVADRAGISRGLLYHYFPTKRDFYVAVLRSAVEEVGGLTLPDPGLPPAEQARRALDAYLRHAREHPHGFLAAHRGALVADAEVRAILEAARERQARRIIRALGLGRSRTARLATLGWIGMVQDVTARWLVAERPALTDVRDTLVGALFGALGVSSQAAAGRSRSER